MSRKDRLQEQLNQLAAAADRNDGAAGVRTLNGIRAEHGHKVADGITRDLIRSGLNNLDDRSTAGDPEARRIADEMGRRFL